MGRKYLALFFDFGFLMFHNAKALVKEQSGPFFYLSKIEGAKKHNFGVTFLCGFRKN
jgi:malate synthase